MKTRRPWNRAAYLPGARHGRWTILERLGGLKGRARCDCGTEKIVQLGNLVHGLSSSCGCLQRELVTTHGFSGTTEYYAWNGMRSRCFSKNQSAWKHYGGRGITVCDRWRHSFEAFRSDMGERPSPKHSVDRVDNDGNYSCGKCDECITRGWPANCRWATAKEQAWNKRDAVDSHWLEHGGRRLTCSQWARELGISRQAIDIRIANGWSAERICTTPAPARLVASLRGRVPGSKLYVHNGVRDTVAGWSRRTGVPHKVLGYRIRRGFTFEEAITPGKLSRRRPRAAKRAA